MNSSDTVYSVIVVTVHSLSHIQLFVTPWTAALQTSLFFTGFQSLLRFMSIESVMPFNHLTLCHLLLLLLPIFPSIRVFSNESTLHISWPKYWSFSFSISPSNEYSGWYPLGLIALLSLQPKGLFRSSPAPQFKSINSSALSLLYGSTLTSIHDHWKNHSSDYTLCLCQQTDVSAF